MASISEKLNYINETKSLMKDKLNDLGSEIDNETTFREYAEKIENLYEEWPKITNTDTNMILNNTKKGKMNIKLKGNTNQFTTTGKNLLNTIDANTTTVNGVTSYRNNGFYYLSGTNTKTDGTWVLPNTQNTDLPVFEIGQTYTMSFKGTLPNGVYAQLNGFKTSTGTQYSIGSVMRTVPYITFTIDSDYSSVTQLFIGIQATATNVDCNFAIQIEKGSTATPYEPYTNGPAPNPDYPQDIEVVSGDNTIKVEGKNLWGEEENGGIDESTGQNTYNANRWRTVGYIKVFSNTAYTLSSNASANIYYIFYYYDNNKSFISSSALIGQASQTATTPNNCEYMRCVIADTATIKTTQRQLEKNNQATTYEAYQSQSYPISLGNIELCKIGNYQDYLYKNNGKWYKYNAINKLVLNGSENWSAHGSIASWFYWDGITNGFTDSTISGYALSNYFTQKAYNTVTSLNNGEFAYGQVAGDTRKRFVIKDTDYTTVADFKSWLSTHNTIVYYVLETPTSTEITDTELINQLDTLESARSYDTTTNITQNTNNLPFILNVSALKKNSSN